MGYQNELLKKVGRNMMKVKCQQSTTMPKMNANWGSSDGGVIGRATKAVGKPGKRSIKGS